MTKFAFLAGAAAALVVTTPAYAKSSKASSGAQEQQRGTAEIPRCARKIGSLAIVEPENQWWRELNLGSPEAILRVFVQQSGCFTLVNRGSAMHSRAMERALAEQGELQQGSNMGAGQVRAADYFLQPDIVSTNKDSGGGGMGAALGGVLGHTHGWANTVGAIAGGINIRKGEASVTLDLVNAHTTEEEALTQGYARKTDISWGAGGGAGWWGGFAAAGGYGYQNTEIGQIIVLAYLDAYIKLVSQLGGISPIPAGAPRQ